MKQGRGRRPPFSLFPLFPLLPLASLFPLSFPRSLPPLAVRSHRRLLYAVCRTYDRAFPCSRVPVFASCRAFPCLRRAVRVSCLLARPRTPTCVSPRVPVFVSCCARLAFASFCARLVLALCSRAVSLVAVFLLSAVAVSTRCWCQVKRVSTHHLLTSPFLFLREKGGGGAAALTIRQLPPPARGRSSGFRA